MALDHLPDAGTHALVVAGALRIHQVGEGRFVAVGVVKKRADFAAIAVVEQTDIGDLIRHGTHSLSAEGAATRTLRHGDWSSGWPGHPRPRQTTGPARRQATQPSGTRRTLAQRLQGRQASPAGLAFLFCQDAHHENRLFQYQRSAPGRAPVGGADRAAPARRDRAAGNQRSPTTSFPRPRSRRSATTSTTTGRKATTASPCSPARRPWNCIAASRATARNPSGASSGAPSATPRATRSP